MIDIKDRKSQVTVGVVLVVIALAGYRFVIARPVYGPSSVGIDVAAQSAPDPYAGEGRAVRGPGSSSATQGSRLQADSDDTAEGDPEPSDTLEKKTRKGQRAGRKRSRKSADQEKDEEKKKEQRSPDTRKRGAPFRKAPSGL